MNILDYLDWRGDLTFAERPFNEVDNLILSTLAYLKMDGLVPENPSASVSIADLPAKYKAAGYDQTAFFNDPYPLAEKAADTARFKDVRVSRYMSRTETDEAVQFAAVTFDLGDGTQYVAYRGTDETIVGWREDFNLALLPKTPGQSEAVDYVNAVAADTAGKLRLGGHSKGGNFAVYAAAFCEEATKKRILSVYSNDGPGFLHEIVDSEAYKSILPRIQKIIPDSSLIGILLSGSEQKRVIASAARGVMQHNPYTWNILGQHFVAADRRDPFSVFMDETMARWIDTLNDEQKQTLITAIFDSLEASGVSTVNDLKTGNLATYNAILQAIKKLDPSMQSEVADAMRKLALAGRDVLHEEIQKKLEALIPNNTPELR